MYANIGIACYPSAREGTNTARGKRSGGTNRDMRTLLFHVGLLSLVASVTPVYLDSTALVNQCERKRCRRGGRIGAEVAVSPPTMASLFTV